MEERRIVLVLCIVVILVLQISSTSVMAWDYAAALSNSILFYEAQRSGKLPGNQRAKWRGDSGLQDGKAQGIDLVGGYHDAGDNVKFGFSMAFTITMLSWSAIEYRSQLEIPGQLGYALEAIKWGTDYFIKAHPEPNVLWGEVGDGYSDHQCWERPEDMTTSRKAYKIDVNNPGSDLAGETAAAMAAASIVFKNTDPAYSSLLVTHAKELFTFANNYRGKYDNSIRIAESFYASASGYDDELLWGAIWLYEATADPYYLNYLVSNAATLGGTSTGMKEFSWDVKYVGVQVLASKILLQGRGGSYTDTLKSYQSKAEYFLCSCLQKNNGDNVQRTPGGLLFVRPWNNVQYVGTAAFILTVYSDYLTSSSQQLQCPGNRVVPSELVSLAQSQIDYILGNNPRATSYMVGFGKTYPQHVHHRASSIVSIKVDSTFVSCLGGFSEWFNRWQSNPNVLVGAIVGGPDQNDDFADQRTNYDQTEPVSCNNAPIIGVLARLHGGYSSPKTPAGPPTTTSVSTPVPHLPGIPHWHPPIHRSVIVIKQEAVASWKYQGRTLYRYAVTLTNVSGRTLTHVILNIQRLYGPAWGITKIGKTSTYTLPQWLRLLHPLQRVNFVYIQAAAAAQIRVASYVVV